MIIRILTEAGDVVNTEAGDVVVTEDSTEPGALLDVYPDALRATAADSSTSPFEADSRLRGG